MWLKWDVFGSFLWTVNRFKHFSPNMPENELKQKSNIEFKHSYFQILMEILNIWLLFEERSMLCAV